VSLNRSWQHQKHEFPKLVDAYVYLGSQPKNETVFRKVSFVSDFVELFLVIILVKKTFRIPSENDGVIVKRFIIKAENVRVFFNRNIVYSVQSKVIHHIRHYLRNRLQGFVERTFLYKTYYTTFLQNVASLRYVNRFFLAL